MIKISITLLVLFSLSGCAVVGGGTSGGIMPRYVSPLHYMDYSCRQMTLTAVEFRKIKAFFQRTSLPLPNRVVVYNQKNNIADEDKAINEKGYSVLLGHQVALKKAAAAKRCSI